MMMIKSNHRSNTVRRLILVGIILQIVLYDLETTKESNRRLDGTQQQTQQTRQGQQQSVSTHRGHGTHYVTLLVGNPPQPQRLALSTGTDYVAFPCAGCDSCGTSPWQPAPYQADNSTTSLAPPCPQECLDPQATCDTATHHTDTFCHVQHMFQSNDDTAGGFHAMEMRDLVLLDMTSDTTTTTTTALSRRQRGVLELDFLCQTRLSGAHFQNDQLAIGFLGMSRSPQSFVQQMHASGQLHRRVFGLCFRDFATYDNDNTVGVSAGTVTLGGYDMLHHSSPLVWATTTSNNNTSNRYQYILTLRNIHAGIGAGDTDALQRAAAGTMSVVNVCDYDPNLASKAPPQQQQAIVETNNPISYLHSSYAKALRTVFQSITGLEYNTNGITLPTDGRRVVFPTLFFQFQVSCVCVCVCVFGFSFW